MSSNFVAISCFIMLIGVASYFLMRDPRFLAPAAFGFIMMAPLGVMFEETKTPKLLFYYTIGLAMVGIIGVITSLTEGTFLNGFLILFGVGFFAFQWVANYQLINADN
ncbi:hypothetical protein [Niabella ginsengisoli]|uniref:DUF3147 family protein n=1 Tax=Niabella ginsengisoli TaxID=522298 RepID=A0ABS9SPH3_9BACT|nr:hypothetical protein [Niabella ginsengisoli]MCH5600270.1 hypothetical protein [Niabella ginsengisoli]